MPKSWQSSNHAQLSSQDGNPPLFKLSPAEGSFHEGSDSGISSPHKQFISKSSLPMLSSKRDSSVLDEFSGGDELELSWSELIITSGSGKWRLWVSFWGKCSALGKVSAAAACLWKGSWVTGSIPILRSFFLMWVFQWFLISLSVLPGNLAAILDHLGINRRNILYNPTQTQKQNPLP